MDVMEARRRLLMMPHGLDTSPVFETYGYKMPAGNTPYEEDENFAITILYHYPPVDFKQTLVTSKVGGTIRVYNGNKAYMDYWNWYVTEGYQRNVINANSEYLRFAVLINESNDSYAYLKETGQILFAGKNSIYYGHRNISELN